MQHTDTSQHHIVRASRLPLQVYINALGTQRAQRDSERARQHPAVPRSTGGL